MTKYYISSISGSDSNSGKTEGAAWKSLSKLSGVTLRPGDQVLLEAGSTFNQGIHLSKVNGTQHAPIHITSYGAGKAPIISDVSGSAIAAVKSDYVIVEGIAIQGSSNSGIQAWDADNWIIRNVTFTEAGGEKSLGASINWRYGDNILIENNTVRESYGDGIFMRDMKGVIVKDNLFVGVHGHDADNVQIQGKNIIIDHNVMVAGTDANVAKGNLVVHGENIYIHDNFLQGGGFGVGLSADHVVVADNIIVDHAKYSWSMGIGFSDEKTGDVSEDLTVTGNHIAGSPNAISFYGGAEQKNSANVMDVKGLDISKNIFHDWSKQAVSFSHVNVEGSYTNNIYYEQNQDVKSNKYAKTDVSKLYQDDNVYIDPASINNSKLVKIQASGDMYNGSPVMKVYHNETLVFETSVTAAHAKGGVADYSFNVNNFDENDKLSVRFVNDKNGAGGDRNLYVHSVLFDGKDISLSSGDRSGKVWMVKGHDDVTFSSKGSLDFTAKDFAVEDGSGSSTIDIDDLLDMNSFIDLAQSQRNTIGSGVHNAGDYISSFKDLATEINTLVDFFG